MRILVLSGIKCRPWIWDGIKAAHLPETMAIVDYPKEITLRCHTISDLIHWVKQTFLYNGHPYEYIIGHSLGGLIALQLSAMPDLHFKKTVLIESFLKPTSSFFHNLLMEHTDTVLKDKVLHMLAMEEANYSAALKAELRSAAFDFTPYVAESNSKLYCLYGNRGESNQDNVIGALQLPKALVRKLHIKIVNNCCHFPMLENTCDFNRILNNILIE